MPCESWLRKLEIGQIVMNERTSDVSREVLDGLVSHITWTKTEIIPPVNIATGNSYVGRLVWKPVNNITTLGLFC